MPGTPLDAQRYISIESFKKDGSGVKTPVWVAPLDGKLIFYTLRDSYKVKRVARNPRVRVAACDARGGVRGPWYNGECRAVDDPEHAKRAFAALRAKYGWQMAVTNFTTKVTGRQKLRKVMEITLAPAPST